VLDELERMNRGLAFTVPELRSARGALRFADGGSVLGSGALSSVGTAAASQAAQQEVQHRVDGAISIALDDGLILKAMESPEGQRVQLRVLHKNRRAVTQAVARR
jgi:hypothetical protein